MARFRRWLARLARNRPHDAAAIACAAEALETIEAISACRHLAAHVQLRLRGASEAACRQLLADPDAWIPRELKVIEMHAVTRRRGLSLAVQLGTETLAAGEHQISGLKPMCI